MYENYWAAFRAAQRMGILTGERYAILHGAIGFVVVRESIAVRPKIQQYVCEVVNYD